MSNTVYQVRRSTIAGVVPTTSSLQLAELGINLADQVLYTSNGSGVFQVGANINIKTVGTQLILSNTIITAVGSNGSAGQVLTSNGTTVSWTTPSGINTAAQYTFTNTITFGSNTSTITGILAFSNSGWGIVGQSNSSSGVVGVSNTYVGVYGSSNSSTGLFGISTSGYGVYVVSNTGNPASFGNSTSQMLFIAANGNVGIANITPDAVLHVQGTANITGAVVIGGTLTAALTGNVTGTASNATNLNNQNAAFYTNATNITTGTLPAAQLPVTTVNTSGNFTVAGNLNFTGANNYFVGVYVGANVVVNTTSHFVGNATVNTNITAGSISLSGVTVNSTIYAGTANNANNLNNQNAAFYTNATNITTGTLPYAQLGANVVNTSGAFTITGVHTHSANINLNANLISGGTSYIANGFSVVAYNLGTISTALTANASLGNYQYMTANAAFTLTAPSTDCAIDILVTNGTGAGTITLSGFTANATNAGDTYATTSTSKYILMIRRINAVATYIWKALQ